MRRRKSYFSASEGDPAPLVHTHEDRVRFGEVDAMGVVWHGNYPALFERSSSELCRKIGLTYDAYHRNNILAPLVQFHTDYFAPLMLDEEFTVTSSMVWTTGARINTEFVVKKRGGDVSVTGFSVQMFVDARTLAPLIVPPPLWSRCLQDWESGKFECLQNGQ